MLEQGTVDTLNEAGLGDRMRREGRTSRHRAAVPGQRHRIDLSALTGGRAITVYSQHEVVRDLIAAGVEHGHAMHFEVSDVALHDVEGEQPFVTFKHADGREDRIDCDYIAGCDGFHGIARQTIPAERLNTFERVYPFAWLGILADAAPSLDGRLRTSRQRFRAVLDALADGYAPVPAVQADEDLTEWSDTRIWDELHTRSRTTRAGRRPRAGSRRKA